MCFDVIGIGNALVDVQLQVDDAFLSTLDYPKGGMTLSSPEEQKRLLESLSNHSYSICSGGSAANTIHGIGALGGQSYYVGRVANDEYGRHYTKDMSDCGVGFPGSGSEDSGTGTSVVLITPDAQRTMITHLGISAQLHPDNVDGSLVEKASLVYIEGYLWCNDETKEAAIRMMKIAKRHDIPVAFTLSDAFVVNSFRDSIMEFIKWDVDILFCNDVEGKALAQTEDADEAFKYLADTCDNLFFTRGDQGVWAIKKGEEKVSVKGYKVNAVDTTGAGDLFAAGALQGLIKKKNLREACILGCYCASQVVSHFGARMPAHSHKDISKIIGEYSE